MNQQKIKLGIKEILEGIGEDIKREGIAETPTRVARLFKNIFYGYSKKLVVMNEKTRNGDAYDTSQIIPITIFKNSYKELLMREVKCISFCEHHLVPFPCTVYVGIIPDELLLGLNKIDRIVKYFAARLQLQEKLATDIVDWINENIKPKGVIVVIKGRHFCAELQGDNGEFITSAVRGIFLKPEEGKNPKEEFLKLMSLYKND